MQIDVIHYADHIKYVIFEAYQVLFPTASLIFTTAKLFHQVVSQRTKHKASTASHL